MLVDHKKYLRHPVRHCAQYTLQEAPAWSSAARHSRFTLSILLPFPEKLSKFMGKATHNPCSMKNSSFEKDKVKWWGVF